MEFFKAIFEGIQTFLESYPEIWIQFIVYISLVQILSGIESRIRSNFEYTRGEVRIVQRKLEELEKKLNPPKERLPNPWETNLHINKWKNL